MKTFYKVIFLLSIIAISSCDDQIYPELQSTTPFLVVDAWVNDKPSPQVITLASSVPYFNQENAPGIEGAEVYVVSESNDTTRFLDIGDGKYQWTPLGNQVFGIVGSSYTLVVNHEGLNYQATSTKNRTTLVDSVYFKFEESGAFQENDFYVAQFLAVDSVGFGDIYWIRAYKNEEFLGKPSEINLAFDAGFSEGGSLDGITFITPIRDGVNPFDEDPENEDEFLSPFEDGDSLLVEIHSITREAFTFLNEVRVQTDRPGGFAELFASPLSNVPTNIVCTSDPLLEVGGFFCVSSVESSGAKLDVTKVPKEE